MTSGPSVLELLVNVLSIGALAGMFALLSALAAPADDRGERIASLPFGLLR